MVSRRALIVAPLYDGEWLPSLKGRSLLSERLTKCLEQYGNYEVRKLDGIVKDDLFRSELENFFDTDGELLFYFYGHGCIRNPNFGVLATSYARLNNEGVLMMELMVAANESRAREVVIILDCCHAGAIIPATNSTISMLANGGLASGRVVLAGCAAHQQGWEEKDETNMALGAFSLHVLEGLEGKARDREYNRVRAGLLANHVTQKFNSWKQHPVHLNREEGEKLCIITSGFPEDRSPESYPDKLPLIIGVPFKPSNLFVGRAAELDSLRVLLVEQNRPVAISASVEGLGGIGKTELVLQLLQAPDIRSCFDTVIWLDGAGPIPPQWHKIAIELGIKNPPDTPEDLVSTVAHELRERGNSLIILDNAYEWHNVASLIPADFPLLVTTRKRWFGGHNFVHSELGVLTDDAAENFLVRMVPELQEDPALKALVHALEGHALALELAGWSINHLGLSAAEYLGRLNKHLAVSDVALSSVRYGKTVDGCLALTWDGLRLEASRTLWRRASLFAPTSAHRDLLRLSFVGNRNIREELFFLMERQKGFEAGILNTRDADFDEAFAELRAFHVLSRVEGYNGERWAMHRLVRDYGRARLKTGEILVHLMSLSEWLKHPSLPLAPEIPHFVVAVLDAARNVGEFKSLRGLRSLGRELFHRQISAKDGVPFNAKEFIYFIRDELRDPKALTIILEGLTDINEDVRLQAVDLLESIGPIPEVLEALAVSLDDPKSQVRETAGRTLAKYGGINTIQILSDVIKGTKPRARLAAVQAIGFMGENAHTVLLDNLTHKDRAVRVEAALLLCEGGRADGLAILLSEFESLSEDTRMRFIDAFGKAKNPQAIPILEKVVRRSSNSDHRVRAIYALRKVAGPDLYALLVSLLKDKSSEVMAVAAEGIESLRKLENPDDILSALASESEKSKPLEIVVISLLNVAVMHKVRLPEKIVWNLMNSANSTIRRHCVYVVEQAEDERRVPLLVGALADEAKEVRAQAEKALIEINDPEVRAKLAEVAHDSSIPHQRVAAISVLAKVNDASIYPLLAKLLKDDNAILRNAAAEAIEGLNIEEGFSLIVNVFARLPDKKWDRRFVGIALRIAAAHGLAIPVGVATKLLKSPDGILKKNCIAAIGSARIKELVPLLIKSLDADRYDSYGVRKEAVNALGLIGDAQAIKPLLELMKKASDEIAYPVALALIRLGAHDEIAAFYNKDKNAGWASRHALITFIGNSKLIEAVPFLIWTLDDAYGVARKTAARFLGLIGDLRSISPLIKMVKVESSNEIKADAVAALILIHLKMGTFRSDPLPSVIKAATASPYYEVKMAAAAALIMMRQAHREGFDGNTYAVKGLIEKYSAEAASEVYKIPYLFPQYLRTEDDDSQFVAAKDIAREIMKVNKSDELDTLMNAAEVQERGRQFADTYLAVMLKVVAGYKVGIPKEEISQMFYSKDALTRQSAAFALVLLGEAEALPYLVKSLRSQDENVRRAAIYAIANNADSSIRQRLTEIAADDSDADIRAAATEALTGDVSNA